jgi:hypothetical protein
MADENNDGGLGDKLVGKFISVHMFSHNYIANVSPDARTWRRLALLTCSLQQTTIPSYAELRSAATTFCNAFASKAPPKEILNRFSTSEDVLACEHGLPQLAPFLGRAYRGREGVKEYFDLLGKYLSYEDMRFGNYVVDTEQSKVSVRGQARFTWTSTDQSWDEVFTYVLEFDKQLKVEKYEVWADSGAAYLAGQGELKGRLADHRS